MSIFCRFLKHFNFLTLFSDIHPFSEEEEEKNTIHVTGMVIETKSQHITSYLSNIMLILPEISKTFKCSGPLLNSVNGAYKLRTPLSDKEFFLRFRLIKL